MRSARQSTICRQYSSILIGSIRDNNGRYAIKIDAHSMRSARQSTICNIWIDAHSMRSARQSTIFNIWIDAHSMRSARQSTKCNIWIDAHSMRSVRKSTICRQYSSILIGSIRDNNGRYGIKIWFHRNFCKSPSFLPTYFNRSRVQFRNWLLRPGYHGCSAMVRVLNLVILIYLHSKLHKVGIFAQQTSLQGYVYVNIISTQDSYHGNRLKLHTYYVKSTSKCYAHNSIQFVLLSHQRHYNGFCYLSQRSILVCLKWRQNMWTGVLSIPAVYHPFVRYADGIKSFIPATRITPVFLSCPHRKSDAFKMPMALLWYVPMTNAFHCSVSWTKGVLFISVPTNHTGLSTMRLFKLDISARSDAGGCAFEGLQLYQVFDTTGRSRTKRRKGFNVSKLYLICMNHCQIITTCFIVDSHYHYIHPLSLVVSGQWLHNVFEH
jgi:hypothetical protein